MFSVEKGVPIPTEETRKNLYPFPDMAVGDSFFIDAGKDSPAVRARVRSAAKKWGKARGSDFEAKEVPGGVRVWRIL